MDPLWTGLLLVAASAGALLGHWLGCPGRSTVARCEAANAAAVAQVKLVLGSAEEAAERAKVARQRAAADRYQSERARDGLPPGSVGHAGGGPRAARVAETNGSATAQQELEAWLAERGFGGQR